MCLPAGQHGVGHSHTSQWQGFKSPKGQVRSQISYVFWVLKAAIIGLASPTELVFEIPLLLGRLGPKHLALRPFAISAHKSRKACRSLKAARH